MHNHNFITKESEIRFFFILMIALALFLVVSFVLGARVERGDVSTPTRGAYVEFPEVELEAKAAYVYDARTQSVLFAQNENERLPLASITKVMAALVAYEKSPAYGTVVVTNTALKTQGDSGLLAEERFSLRDLLDFSLISSSNDGMRAVALSLGSLSSLGGNEEAIIADFIKSMNEKAASLGLENMYFFNETGLDESENKEGAYGSASDVTTLLAYIMVNAPELLEATRQVEANVTSLDNFQHTATNTNVIVSEIPGLLASKTGFTDMAGGNLTFVFDPEIGRPVIVTILGSSVQGRFEDAKKLVEATLIYIKGE